MDYPIALKKHILINQPSFLLERERESAFCCLNMIGSYCRKLSARSLLASDLRTFSLLLGLYAFDTLTIELLELLYQQLHLAVSKRSVYYLVTDLCAQKLIAKVSETPSSSYRLKNAGFRQMVSIAKPLRERQIVAFKLPFCFEQAAFSENYACIAPGAHKLNVDTAAIQLLSLSLSDLYMSYDVEAAPWTEGGSKLPAPLLREEGALATDLFFADSFYTCCAYEDSVRKRGIHIEVDNDTERLGNRGQLTRKLLSYCNAMNAQMSEVDAQRCAGLYHVLIVFSSKNRGKKFTKPPIGIPSISTQFRAKLASLRRIQSILNTTITTDNIFALASALYGKRFEAKLRELLAYGARQGIPAEEYILTSLFHIASHAERTLKEHNKNNESSRKNYLIASLRKRLCKLVMSQYAKEDPDGMIAALKNGLSIQVTHLDSVGDYMEANTLSFYLKTLPLVTEKLRIMENAPSITNFFDCKPIFQDIRSGHDKIFRGFLRNIICLNDGADSLLVAIEDISNDLGAYTRVREFFEAPCRIGSHVLLFILTDHFTFFDGNGYDEYNLFGRTDAPSILSVYQDLFHPKENDLTEIPQGLPLLWRYCLSYVMMDKSFYSAISEGYSYEGDYPGLYVNSNGTLVRVDPSAFPQPGYFNQHFPVSQTNTLSLNKDLFR